MKLTNQDAAANRRFPLQQLRWHVNVTTATVMLSISLALARKLSGHLFWVKEAGQKPTRGRRLMDGLMRDFRTVPAEHQLMNEAPPGVNTAQTRLALFRELGGFHFCCRPPFLPHQSF